jgi:hypothetical protein
MIYPEGIAALSPPLLLRYYRYVACFRHRLRGVNIVKIHLFDYNDGLIIHDIIKSYSDKISPGRCST